MLHLNQRITPLPIPMIQLAVAGSIENKIFSVARLLIGWWFGQAVLDATVVPFNPICG